MNRNKKIYFRFALGFSLAISNTFLVAETSNTAPVSIQTVALKIIQAKGNINFHDLPFNQSIQTIKGNGSNKLAVFYEIDCGYCRYLEKYELSQIKNVTVYTFLFSNEENHNSFSWKKAESIWCAADVTKAWQDFIHKDDITKKFSACKNPLKENKTLALKLGVKATPTIVFSNGNKAVGMIKANEIEQRLLDANFYTD